jgi:hypothetical protein
VLANAAFYHGEFIALEINVHVNYVCGVCKQNNKQKLKQFLLLRDSGFGNSNYVGSLGSEAMVPHRLKMPKVKVKWAPRMIRCLRPLVERRHITHADLDKK